MTAAAGQTPTAPPATNSTRASGEALVPNRETGAGPAPQDRPAVAAAIDAWLADAGLYLWQDGLGDQPVR